jgi:hypothetical protein
MNNSHNIDPFRQDVVDDPVRGFEQFSDGFIVVLWNNRPEQRELSELFRAQRDLIDDLLSITGRILR